EGLTITRDGVLVDPAAWDIPVPVDPGDHEILASAPDRITWTSTVSTNSLGDVVEVDVPTLRRAEKKEARSAPPPAPVVEETGMPAQRKLALGAVGLGVISL